MKTLPIISRKYFIFLFSAFVMFSFQQCSKGGDDNANPGGGGGGTPPPACDLSNVTFSATIWPIINTNCVSCHSGASPNGGVRLESYATIVVQASIPVGSYGSLYGAITHNSGNNNMPQNADKLSDCNISKIKTWIDAGMPNN